MIDLDAARALIAERLHGHALAPVTVPLDDALGAVLADDLVVSADMPGFAHSAMDGYAVRADDLATDAPTTLRVIGDCRAGRTQALALEPGECALIATGAALPAGADTVVIRELSAPADGEPATRAGTRVVLQLGTARGANVRRADEDYARGDVALAAGVRLGAAQLGVAASFGLASIAVRRPRVAVLVTGDELVAAGEALQPGQRHDSNGALLRALLRDHGAEVVACAHERDDPAAIATWLATHAARADLLISTGGASMGEADYLPRLVAEAGDVAFHRVRIRPGMPVLFGRVATTPMLVLPGNPVSVVATFIAIARPVLAALVGSTVLDPPPFAVRLAAGFTKDHARLELRRARLAVADDGTLWAHPHGSLGSGALRSVAESDALLALPAPPATFQRGDIVPCRRLQLDGSR